MDNNDNEVNNRFRMVKSIIENFIPFAFFYSYEIFNPFFFEYNFYVGNRYFSIVYHIHNSKYTLTEHISYAYFQEIENITHYTEENLIIIRDFLVDIHNNGGQVFYLNEHIINSHIPDEQEEIHSQEDILKEQIFPINLFQESENSEQQLDQDASSREFSSEGSSQTSLYTDDELSSLPEEYY